MFIAALAVNNFLKVFGEVEPTFFKCSDLLKRKKLTGASIFQGELRAGPLLKFNKNILKQDLSIDVVQDRGWFS